MTSVIINDAQRYQLIVELVRRAPEPYSVRLSATNQQVTIQDEHLARLLSRLNLGSWVILPYFGASKDAWLLTADSSVRLEQAHTRLVRFLIPSYGFFPTTSSGVQRFDPDASAVQNLAAPLFPAGYYSWHSFPRDRSTILDRLILWLELEANEPKVQQDITYTYKQLSDTFAEALDDQRWEEAEWAVAELGRRHLATAENILFLNLQMLARRGRWKAIWQDDAFPVWAELTVPRSVRSLLLTACYTETLQAFEKEDRWDEGLSVFAEARGRLGRLLSGPFHLDQPSVARMVIYRAVADQDAARIALLQSSDLDLLSRHMLQALIAAYPPPDNTSDGNQAETMATQAIRALSDQDYATADEVIPKISDPAARTVLLIELAFHTHDDQICDRAWHAYQSLNFTDQEDLPHHPRYVRDYLTYLKDRLLPTISQDDPVVPTAEGSSGNPNVNQPLEQRAWLAIGELELRLREVIATRYQVRFRAAWEDNLHPDPRVLERWRDVQDRDRGGMRNDAITALPLIHYTYLNDLSGMIQRQWALFGDILGYARTGRRELQDKIIAISRVRNPLAHNRPVPEPELERALVYCTELLDQFGDA